MAAFLVVYDPSKGKEQEMVAALHRWGATRIFRGAWVLGRANVDPRGHGGASGSGAPPRRAEWTIPSRRADQGRDCGAAEIQRIA